MRNLNKIWLFLFIAVGNFIGACEPFIPAQSNFELTKKEREWLSGPNWAAHYAAIQEIVNRGIDLATLDAFLANKRKFAVVYYRTFKTFTVAIDRDDVQLFKYVLLHHPEALNAQMGMLNAKNLGSEGDTALIVEAKNNNPKIVYALLMHGADPRIIDKVGKTVFDYAKDKPGVLQAIKQAKEDLEHKRLEVQKLMEKKTIEDVAELISEFAVAPRIKKVPEEEREEDIA